MYKGHKHIFKYFNKSHSDTWIVKYLIIILLDISDKSLVLTLRIKLNSLLDSLLLGETPGVSVNEALGETLL